MNQKNNTFEENMKRLETIVRAMERGDVPLEESLKLSTAQVLCGFKKVFIHLSDFGCNRQDNIGCTEAYVGEKKGYEAVFKV